MVSRAASVRAASLALTVNVFRRYRVGVRFRICVCGLVKGGAASVVVPKPNGPGPFLPAARRAVVEADLVKGRSRAQLGRGRGRPAKLPLGCGVHHFVDEDILTAPAPASFGSPVPV